ncbi:MAG: hypothetical protein K1Y36_01745 [Blastocatellia bacterium]|nr:hypothetical protein [Blastocatellia bacterium]
MVARVWSAAESLVTDYHLHRAPAGAPDCFLGLSYAKETIRRRQNTS